MPRALLERGALFSEHAFKYASPRGIAVGIAGRKVRIPPLAAFTLGEAVFGQARHDQWQPVQSIAKVTSSYDVDTSVTGGDNYYYVVSVVNSAGESANSEDKAKPEGWWTR